MKREGFDMARCTVSRLMQKMGLKGVVGGKSVRTTISDISAPSPLVGLAKLTHLAFQQLDPFALFTRRSGARTTIAFA
jgi:hypothetical protein